MNDRHNRIAGCQAAVDAARAQCDIAARQLADSMIASQDDGGFVLGCEFENAGVNFRAAQESYAAALDELADALRR